MSSSIVLTVVSDDNPGVVESLSEVIAAHGGNWTESSMLSLAGKFAGILLVQVPAQRTDEFISALEALQSQGLHIVVQRSDIPSAPASSKEYSIELVGQDHPGIVNEITGVLAKYAINVLELETTVQSASMSGESLFIAHANILVPAAADIEKLRSELEALANELMVDIELDA
jgi:glycine cleavage system regulatory protein